MNCLIYAEYQKALVIIALAIILLVKIFTELSGLRMVNT